MGHPEKMPVNPKRSQPHPCLPASFLNVLLLGKGHSRGSQTSNSFDSICNVSSKHHDFLSAKQKQRPRNYLKKNKGS